MSFAPRFAITNSLTAGLMRIERARAGCHFYESLLLVK